MIPAYKTDERLMRRTNRTKDLTLTQMASNSTLLKLQIQYSRPKCYRIFEKKKRVAVVILIIFIVNCQSGRVFKYIFCTWQSLLQQHRFGAVQILCVFIKCSPFQAFLCKMQHDYVRPYFKLKITNSSLYITKRLLQHKYGKTPLPSCATIFSFSLLYKRFLLLKRALKQTNSIFQFNRVFTVTM